MQFHAGFVGIRLSSLEYIVTVCAIVLIVWMILSVDTKSEAQESINDVAVPQPSALDIPTARPVVQTT